MVVLIITIMQGIQRLMVGSTSYLQKHSHTQVRGAAAHSPILGRRGEAGARERGDGGQPLNQ